MFGNKITIREKALNCPEDDEMTKKKRCIPVRLLKHSMHYFFILLGLCDDIRVRFDRRHGHEAEESKPKAAPGSARECDEHNDLSQPPGGALSTNGRDQTHHH